MQPLKLAAAAVVATTALLIPAGSAVAVTRPSTTGRAAAAACRRAEARLPVLQQRKSLLDARVTNIESKIQRAQSRHHDTVVSRLQERLTRVQTHEGKLVQLIGSITNRCNT